MSIIIFAIMHNQNRFVLLRAFRLYQVLSPGFGLPHWLGTEMFILIFGPSKRVLGSFGYRWGTGSLGICSTALTGDRNVYTYFWSILWVLGSFCYRWRHRLPHCGTDSSAEPMHSITYKICRDTQYSWCNCTFETDEWLNHLQQNYIQIEWPVMVCAVRTQTCL